MDLDYIKRILEDTGQTKGSLVSKKPDVGANARHNSENIKICFSGNCDINVNYDYVEKEGEKMYFYGDALMYAAIFSDKSIYEYHVKRLMQRTNELLLLYDTKAVLLSDQGCPQDVNLFVLKSIVNNIQDSGDLTRAANAADDLERENERATCRLW